ncbi:MAG: hypothetical protein E6J34_09555 [Chloroflexi bacterium]|nr:MAG: hypothetical protein E6J34_09555 [Chloroflexota bacterium]
MERQDSAWQQQRAREELLLLFLKSYEEGNLEVFGAILEQAETDPELDTLIWSAFLTHLSQKGIHPAPEEEKEGLIALLQQSLLSNRKRPEPPPLTLADIAARMQVELILHRADYADLPAIRRALDTLVQFRDPLPDPLDLLTIQAIFLECGLAVPSPFDNAFLQAARRLQEKRAVQ